MNALPVCVASLIVILRKPRMARSLRLDGEARDTAPEELPGIDVKPVRYGAVRALPLCVPHQFSIMLSNQTCPPVFLPRN
jgi:hypothetical protein